MAANRRIDLQEWIARGDLHIRDGHHLTNPAGEGRYHLRLHLHGFDYREAIAGRDDVAGLHRNRHHHSRRGGPHDSAIVAIDTVRYAVHFDTEARPLFDRNHMEALSEDCEPALKCANRLDRGIDSRPIHLNAVLPQAHAIDVHGISLRVAAKLDSMPYLIAHLRPAAQGGRIKQRLLHAQLSLVGFNRSLDQRHIYMAMRDVLALSREAVHPADVDLAALHFLPAQQIQQECAVAAAAFNDHHAFLQHSLQSRQSFFAIGSEGNDLCDHGIEVRRNGVAFLHAGVDAHTGTSEYAKALHYTGGWRKSVAGILGVQPHFNRVAVRDRRMTLQASALRNVDLQLDQVNSGRAFGYRMLDLQAGIHLHEQETFALWLIEKFDRSRIAIVGSLGDADRRSTQLMVLFASQCGRRRLLQNFLMPALDGAVANSYRPGGAMMIGYDLDFYMTRAAHDFLQEHSRIAKRFERFAARAG